ncbi:MAG: hypothetical protein J7L31_00515 [Thermoplasmata archaeon]|nr:hypothetical protein [Thermoplasmata archaeon]
MSDLLDFLKYSHHQAIINNELPLSIGGGMGQSRTYMLLLRKSHLGEVSVTGVAERVEGDLREEEYLRAGVSSHNHDSHPPPSFLK